MVIRIILFLVFWAIVQGLAFAQIKISEMPVASSVSDADLTMIVQAGANKQATASLLRQILASNITDSTTVGRAIIKVANPSAIRFLRVNADNSVTLLDASSFLTAIGGGASTWGAIGGTLSNQTDLQAALDAKLASNGNGSALTGITGPQISFADTDSNFAATNIQAAIEELDDINGSGPNAADGKVSWSQLANVPAGFADGSDDGSGGSSGTLNTIKENGTQLGGSTIVTLDFLGADFDLTESPTNEANVVIASAIARDAEVAAAYQPLDSDLTSIAALTTTSFGRGLLDDADATAGRASLGVVIGTNVQAFDSDLTTYAGITPSSNAQSFLGAADYSAMRTQLGLVIGTNVQAFDADLTTYSGITPSANVQSLLGAADYAAMRTQLGLVIGTNVLAPNGSGASLTGITGPQVAFADTDNNWTATNVQAALEELDDVINGGLPNATTGKVDWSQLVTVPAGFADGVDDVSGGGGDGDAIHDNVAGEIVAITDKTTPVAADHLLIEDSAAANVKKDITIGSQETALEGVMDLQDFQGAVIDAQVPNTITIDLATTATTLATARNIGNVSFNGSADIVPQTVQVVDSTDATSSIAMFDSATGNLQPKTDAGLSYNASTGAIAATNLSGTNTGDQTITLTGDVTGSGTGSFAATLADNSVDGTDIALGSDAQGDVMYYDGTNWVRLAPGTSGNFLRTNGAAANPSWNSVTAAPGGSDTQVQFNDAGSLGGDAGFTYNKTTDTITVTSLTTTSLSATTFEFEGSTADASETVIAVVDPTADRTFTLPNGSGTAIISGDTLTGDVTATLASGATTATIAANSVALTTDTTGNYVASVATTAPLTGGAAGSEGATLTVALDQTATFDFTGSVVFDSDALRLDDTNASHQLILTPGSDLTANRVLTITTGDAARTLTLAGDATISGTSSGTNTGDQTPANPTASVGLSAVNGSAATFMRSDGAPALSQSITPTWSGLHIFDDGVDIKNGATTAGLLRIYEDSDDGANFASFSVPPLAANTVYTLPPNDGNANQVLHTDGSGVLTWDTDDGAGGGAPTDADYLVGTANGSLSAEIVVGTSPGGELGGTWASPTIDDGVTVDAWVMGASAATTPAANDNDTSLATTAYAQSELTAYATDSVTFQNKDLTNANNTLPCEFIVACSDLTTALTTGTTKAYFRAPYAFTVTSVSASVLTAPTGAILIVDINDGVGSIMATNKLSIDATESTSITAATAAGITDTAIAADAVVAIDIDQIGSTVAGAGLIVTIQGTR